MIQINQSSRFRKGTPHWPPPFSLHNVISNIKETISSDVFKHTLNVTERDDHLRFTLPASAITQSCMTFVMCVYHYSRFLFGRFDTFKEIRHSCYCSVNGRCFEELCMLQTLMSRKQHKTMTVIWFNAVCIQQSMLSSML